MISNKGNNSLDAVRSIFDSIKPLDEKEFVLTEGMMFEETESELNESLTQSQKNNHQSPPKCSQQSPDKGHLSEFSEISNAKSDNEIKRKAVNDGKNLVKRIKSGKENLSLIEDSEVPATKADLRSKFLFCFICFYKFFNHYKVFY